MLISLGKISPQSQIFLIFGPIITLLNIINMLSTLLYMVLSTDPNFL